MQFSSRIKLAGLVGLLSLLVGTGIYQKQEDSNLMYLFGLYLLTGILGAFYVFKVILPAIGDSITTAMVESGEEPEESPMVRIRGLIADGEYKTAAEELVHVAAANPGDRVPWVERAALLDGRLSDFTGAVQTLEIGLKSYEWEDDDVAFFLFRIAEIHEENGAKADAVSTLERIVERFPKTRYAANATHKKRKFNGGDASGDDPAPSGSPSPPPPSPQKRSSPPPPSTS